MLLAKREIHSKINILMSFSKLLNGIMEMLGNGFKIQLLYS